MVQRGLLRAARPLVSFALTVAIAGCSDDTSSGGGADGGPGSGGSTADASSSAGGALSSGGFTASGGSSSLGGSGGSSLGADGGSMPPGSRDSGASGAPSADAMPTPPGAVDGGNDASPDGSTDGATVHPPATTELVTGDVTLVGLTSDGWAVFRQADALRAVELSAPFETRDLADKAGSVVIRGRFVFNWADMDWVANVGKLSVWSAVGGAHVIGPTQYAEGLIGADDGGGFFAYTANLTATTMDVVIATSVFSSSQVVLKGVGRGTNATCTATMGFVGSRFFAAACAPEARTASLQRFDRSMDGWKSTVLSTAALPVWSADATGEKVFFQADTYAGEYVEGGQVHTIDNGVGTGVMLPDGSSILYTVNDQLRRTALPSINPITIVTTGYSQFVGFSPSFHLALYSTKVVYESTTKRDLRVATTDAFNPNPTVLVSQPIATLPRSFITADEKRVLYLADVAATGGNLHVVAISGTEQAVLPGVIDAAVTSGGGVLFTDHASDPDRYPMVTNLEYVDFSAGVLPRLVESKVVDGKSFLVDAPGKHVVYVRSSVEQDGGAPQTGLFVRNLE